MKGDQVDHTPQPFQVLRDTEQEKPCMFFLLDTLREKCPYSELFWSLFSCVRTKYGEILRIPYTDQNNFEYEHFLLRYTYEKSNAVGLMHY